MTTVAARSIRTILACAVLCVVAACAAGFLVRWPLVAGVWRARAIRLIETSSGLSVRNAGPMSLVLLPRPVVTLSGLVMEGPNGTVSIDAGAATGTLSLLGLAAGHLRVVQTALVRPTIVIDLDHVGPILAGLLRAREGTAGESPPGQAFLHTDGLVVRSGVIRLLSKDDGRDTLLTDVTAAFEWPRDESGATLNGNAAWRGEPVSVGLMLDAPAEWMAGRASTGYAHVKTTLLDLTASGTIAGQDALTGSGWLTASSANLPGFLRMVGTPLPQLDKIQQGRLSGKVTLADRELSMSGVQLGLDAMLFEGALSFNAAAGHAGIAGTLATDDIDLGPFLRALPDPLARAGWWSTVPLDTASVANDNIDLRISATKARLGRIVFEDGGLSLQSRDGRMEISLAEARVYDGLFKGRVVAQAIGDATQIRADATFSQIDLQALAGDIDPGLQISGTSSGHMTIEGMGATPRALVRSLTGHGTVSVRNGSLQADSVPFVTRAETTGPETPPAATQAVPFDSAWTDFSVSRGVVSLVDGALLRPDARASVGGWLSLPLQTADLRMVFQTPGDESEAPTGAATAVTLTGTWGDLQLGTGPAPATDTDHPASPATAPAGRPVTANPDRTSRP